MFTIKTAAELSGIPVLTIRAWERRYGVCVPPRSSAGYRLYSSSDIARLRQMRLLVESGSTPRAAADALHSADQTIDGAELSGTEGLPSETELRRGIAAACATGRLAEVADAWLMPLLDQLGELWANGQVSLLVEHAISAIITVELIKAYEQVGRQKGRPVLLGLPQGAAHDIGILTFAVSLRQVGVAAEFIGSNLSKSAWVHEAGRSGASIAITSCHRSDDARSTNEVVSALTLRSGVWVGVGGSQQALVGRGHQLGHSFVAARDIVVRAHRGAPVTAAR